MTSTTPDGRDAAEPLTLIASCAFGLEAIVRRELKTLGIEAKVAAPGQLRFQGDAGTLVAANLHLRCADRVRVEVARFAAPDFDALFETTRSLPWSDWIEADAAFPVDAKSIRSALTSVPAIQRSVKRAVSDALIAQHADKSLGDKSLGGKSLGGKPLDGNPESPIDSPSPNATEHAAPGKFLPETGATYRIEASLIDDEVTLTIDTTGRSLHRRGYRTDVSAAPLKETLAAALVMLSYWRRDRALIDPFCGSGTIVIEAAMIGRGIPPGLQRLRDRGFSFCDWPRVSDALIDAAIATAESNIESTLPQRLIGRDIDSRILRAARDNAARAGVADDVHFEPGDVRETTSTQRFGCVITNPPYGQRIGDDVDALYAELPTVLSRLPTWSHYVLTAVENFESIMGRPADRRRKLYNGRIACTYFQFHGPKPVAEERDDTTLVHAVGKAAFGGVDAKAKHQAELFAARLTNRAKHLRRFPTRRGITCYRLYERDVPEIPLVVDRYEDHLHITEYERPHERDPTAHVAWLDLMQRTAAETLDVAVANVHLKSRTRQRGKTQYQKVDDRNRKIIVHEGGLKFLVNLQDYVDTGLFLDHRVTRDMVRRESAGKRVLNLFCYTGSFTVYAVDGGAASTASVDLSQTYTSWTEQNLSINKMIGPQHQTFAMDVREFVANHSRGEHYDLVVLDPPTFSNSKKTDQDWDVQRHAATLIEDLLPLMSTGGVIYFSSNFRRLKFDPASLPLSAHHEISRQTVPDDYRNRRIHRCWRLVK